MSSSGIAARRTEAFAKKSAEYSRQRARILDAASRICIESGYRALTVTLVAEKAGLDRASLYYYAGSKHDIIQELVSNVLSSNLEMIDDIRRTHDRPIDQIDAIFKGVSAKIREQAWVFIYVQENIEDLRGANSGWASGLHEQSQRFEAVLIEILEAGVNAGEFTEDLDIEIAAQAFWGMINWTSRRYGRVRRNPGLDKIGATFAQVFLHGIAS